MLNTVGREGWIAAGNPARSKAKMRSSRVTTLTLGEDIRCESNSGHASLIQSTLATLEWLSKGMIISVLVPDTACAAAHTALRAVRITRQISRWKRCLEV